VTAHNILAQETLFRLGSAADSNHDPANHRA